MLILLGIVLFILLVVVHEYGHFIAAKKSGVEVEEFGLGFPPRAKVLTRKNGTTYTLNWLPIGGFVKLKGENDSAREPGSFGAASLKNKTKIISAGVVMNFLAAAVIFTILAFIGMPRLIDNQFSVKSDAKISRQEVFAGYVEANSPASNSGIAVGDRINSINGVQLTASSQLSGLTKQFADKPVQVTYTHDKTVQTKTIQLRSDPTKGNLGVSPAEQTLVRSTWSAPIVGVGTTIQFSVQTLKGLGSAIAHLFTGHASEAGQAVTGPVGIVVVLKDLAKQGLVFVLFLIGVISVSLGVMNLLPIPALDGGRLFVLLLFRALKKPLTKETEERIHGTGMAALLLLAVVITVLDIGRFF